MTSVQKDPGDLHIAAGDDGGREKHGRQNGHQAHQGHRHSLGLVSVSRLLGNALLVVCSSELIPSIYRESGSWVATSRRPGC